MLLPYSSSLFGSVAWFLLFSFQTTTSASPIETSWLSGSSPNVLDKRTPGWLANPTHRVCETVFGCPNIAHCEVAVEWMKEEDNRENAVRRHFWNAVPGHPTRFPGHRSSFTEGALPRIFKFGNCAILISTMQWVKDSYFGFLIGNIPVTPTDMASFDEVSAVVEQVNNHCVKDKPQGNGSGGIQRAGRNLNLAVIVFAQSQYEGYISKDYYFNWEDMSILGRPLMAKPRATD